MNNITINHVSSRWVQGAIGCGDRANVVKVLKDNFEIFSLTVWESGSFKIVLPDTLFLNKEEREWVEGELKSRFTKQRRKALPPTSNVW